MRMVVDLPAPLGPRKPKTSPLLTARAEVVDGDEIAEALDEVLDHDGVRRGSGMMRCSLRWLTASTKRSSMVGATC